MTTRDHLDMNMIERHARAYDPVGWAWFDNAPDDHPAKPIFLERALRQSQAAIEALDKHYPDRDRDARVAALEAVVEASRLLYSIYSEGDDRRLTSPDGHEAFRRVAAALKAAMNGPS